MPLANSTSTRKPTTAVRPFTAVCAGGAWIGLGGVSLMPGSLSISSWYQRAPSTRSATPMCSSKEWIDCRWALLIRKGAKR